MYTTLICSCKMYFINYDLIVRNKLILKSGYISKFPCTFNAPHRSSHLQRHLATIRVNLA